MHSLEHHAQHHALGSPYQAKWPFLAERGFHCKETVTLKINLLWQLDAQTQKCGLPLAPLCFVLISEDLNKPSQALFGKGEKQIYMQQIFKIQLSTCG